MDRLKKKKDKNKILPKQGYPADLAPYLNKRIMVVLNGGRRVIGRVIGYDLFMNLSLEDAMESSSTMGTGVKPLFRTVIRGESIIFWECMETVESTKIKNSNN
jgi:small nuclear ribonucleoprotein G